jgi:acyl phosphate:glycerol-3-phosphate acyltransferase
VPVAHIALIVAIYLMSYLLGAVNFSILAAQIFLKQDLRKVGSGNAGFTNLLRLGNRKLAVTVLVLDVARGWFVLWICKQVPLGIHWPFMALPLLLGNLYPVFHRFKGGKGIAVSIGIILAICPTAALTGTISLLAIIGITRRVSAGSLTFVCCAMITAFLISSIEVWLVCTLLFASALWTHRDNIKRLIHSTEPPLTLKK